MSARDDFEVAVARWARERLISEGWVFIDESDYLPLAAEVGLNEMQAGLVMKGLESRGLVFREGRHYKDALPLILAFEIEADRTAFYESNVGRRELLAAAADALDAGETGIEYTGGASDNYTSRSWNEAAAAAQALEVLGHGDYRPTLGKHFYFSITIDGYSVARDADQLAATLPVSADEDPETSATVDVGPSDAFTSPPVTGGRQAQAFISYSHKDRPFALALHEQLVAQEVDAFIDEVDIEIGESLIRKVSDAIVEGDFVVALITEHSVNSEWCRKELSIAVTDGINNKRVKVLPIVFGGVEPPRELSDVKQLRVDGEPDAGKVAARLIHAMTRLRGLTGNTVDRPADRESITTSGWTISHTDGLVGSEGRDAAVYLWWIERGDHIRPLTVFISGTAMASVDSGLPQEVARAKQTDGRSVVEAVLREDNPPRCVMVSTQGIRPMDEDEPTDG